MQSIPGEHFLANFPWSREACHSVARSLSSADDVTPLAVQGANSYSVRAGEGLVVQFRSKPVDLAVHERALSIHGSKYVVPLVLRHEQPVYVYSSPYRGKTYCEQGILSISIAAQKNTLTDLAVFFAQSCHHPRSVMDIPIATIESYLKDCLTLREVSHKVQFLLDNLGMEIYSSTTDSVDKLADLPFVLVHDDLGSLNILTDNNGNVTGILDWNGSQYLPLGWNLYGVQEFWGYMRVDGWVDRKEREELEKVFWDAFWGMAPLSLCEKRERVEFAITIAKGIGLLWRNVGPDGVESMLQDYPEGLMYLRALL
jgi:hypothetical protein